MLSGEAESPGEVIKAVQSAFDRLCAVEGKGSTSPETLTGDDRKSLSKAMKPIIERTNPENNLSNLSLDANEAGEGATGPPKNPLTRPLSLVARKRSDSPTEEEDRATFEDCFFDLLFSAALSVYGAAADLTSFVEVGQFAAFFTLLWWSWWCQTLYDVRYRGQYHSGFFSVCAHRFTRIFLLGTWVAFSTCASEFSRGIYTNFSAMYALTRAALLMDKLISTMDAPPPRINPEEDKKASTRFLCHLVSIVSSTVSLLCWCASRFLASDMIRANMKPYVFGLWALSFVVDIVSQVFVELYGPYHSLSTTHLVERLALFSLIIFGAGFENIGLALNAISPREASVSGGWRTATVVNSVSAVSIIMLLFFGYFRWAVKRLNASPIVVLSWSYLHIILHLASAVLVVGLSKVIRYVLRGRRTQPALYTVDPLTSFSNTAEVLRAFDTHPTQHLPSTPDWQAYIHSHFPTHVGFDSMPDIRNATSLFDFQVSAIQLTIVATQGAVVPTADEAFYLIRSTQVFRGMRWPEALQTQLQSYFNLVQSVETPNTGIENVQNNLFQFYWIFMCAAFYMLADVALKSIQGIGEASLARRATKWSLSARVAFAALLIAVQGAYAGLHDRFANSGLVKYVLPVLAIILLVECLTQSALANARCIQDRIEVKTSEKKKAMGGVPNDARRRVVIQQTA